eukprot:TRINITY_DN10476_c0_g1_i1.p1 TRINITY_DN10476_c0_g1~~TRINITY_DN10476_c0_g1_i1.p1  ORF type:complete len:296 (+),score=66.96 TRINITY_DN10476_c0_g1_i1:42-929(+)
MSEQKHHLSPAATFACSMAGGVTGWMPIHPFDVLKTRMQINPNAPFGTLISTMVKDEGHKGFYSGLSAAVARQVVYTTLRLGLYDILRDTWTGRDKSKETFRVRAATSTVAGGLAAAMSCPIEVALIRMYQDNRLPVDQRRHYTSVFNAVARIAREEGVLTYWRGSTPTVCRACIVGATQVGCYDQFKSMLLTTGCFEEGVQLHLSAAVIAGFVYSLASNPFDTCKSRMQGQVPLPDGSLKYRNLPQTALKIARTDGFLALWSGFPPYFARSGGHTVCMFLAVEQYKKLARSFNL